MQQSKKVGLYLEDYDAPKFVANNEEMFVELELASEEEKPVIIEKILANNIRLLHYIIRKRYPSLNTLCQRIRVTPDDFFSTGMYALLKSVHTFQVSKGYKFATYATRLIHNEFGMFMRKHKRSFTDMSVHTVTHEGGNGSGSELTLLDMLPDDHDFLAEIVFGELGFMVMDEMERLIKPRELAILRMFISGGDDGEGMTQKDISIELGLSQSYISRLVAKTLIKARRIYAKVG